MGADAVGRYLIFVWSLMAGRQLLALGQQLGQRADDAVGLGGGVRRQAVAMDVDPDRVDAKALRRHDFRGPPRSLTRSKR